MYKQPTSSYQVQLNNPEGPRRHDRIDEITFFGKELPTITNRNGGTDYNISGSIYHTLTPEGQLAFPSTKTVNNLNVKIPREFPFANRGLQIADISYQHKPQSSLRNNGLGVLPIEYPQNEPIQFQPLINNFDRVHFNIPSILFSCDATATLYEDVLAKRRHSQLHKDRVDKDKLLTRLSQVRFAAVQLYAYNPTVYNDPALLPDLHQVESFLQWINGYLSAYAQKKKNIHVFPTMYHRVIAKLEPFFNYSDTVIPETLYNEISQLLLQLIAQNQFTRVDAYTTMLLLPNIYPNSRHYNDFRRIVYTLYNFARMPAVVIRMEKLIGNSSKNFKVGPNHSIEYDKDGKPHYRRPNGMPHIEFVTRPVNKYPFEPLAEAPPAGVSFEEKKVEQLVEAKKNLNITVKAFPPEVVTKSTQQILKEVLETKKRLVPPVPVEAPDIQRDPLGIKNVKLRPVQQDDDEDKGFDPGEEHAQVSDEARHKHLEGNIRRWFKLKNAVRMMLKWIDVNNLRDEYDLLLNWLYITSTIANSKGFFKIYPVDYLEEALRKIEEIMDDIKNFMASEMSEYFRIYEKYEETLKYVTIEKTILEYHKRNKGVNRAVDFIHTILYLLYNDAYISFKNTSIDDGHFLDLYNHAHVIKEDLYDLIRQLIDNNDTTYVIDRNMSLDDEEKKEPEEVQETQEETNVNTIDEVRMAAVPQGQTDEGQMEEDIEVKLVDPNEEQEVTMDVESKDETDEGQKEEDIEVKLVDPDEEQEVTMGDESTLVINVPTEDEEKSEDEKSDVVEDFRFDVEESVDEEKIKQMEIDFDNIGYVVVDGENVKNISGAQFVDSFISDGNDMIKSIVKRKNKLDGLRGDIQGKIDKIDITLTNARAVRQALESNTLNKLRARISRERKHISGLYDIADRSENDEILMRYNAVNERLRMVNQLHEIGVANRQQHIRILEQKTEVKSNDLKRKLDEIKTDEDRLNHDMKKIEYMLTEVKRANDNGEAFDYSSISSVLDEWRKFETENLNQLHQIWAERTPEEIPYYDLINFTINIGEEHFQNVMEKNNNNIQLEDMINEELFKKQVVASGFLYFLNEWSKQEGKEDTPDIAILKQQIASVMPFGITLLHPDLDNHFQKIFAPVLNKDNNTFDMLRIYMTTMQYDYGPRAISIVEEGRNQLVKTGDFSSNEELLQRSKDFVTNKNTTHNLITEEHGKLDAYDKYKLELGQSDREDLNNLMREYFIDRQNLNIYLPAEAVRSVLGSFHRDKSYYVRYHEDLYKKDPLLLLSHVHSTYIPKKRKIGKKLQ